jgi:hypothetical protein
MTLVISCRADLLRASSGGRRQAKSVGLPVSLLEWPSTCARPLIRVLWPGPAPPEIMSRLSSDRDKRSLGGTAAAASPGGRTGSPPGFPGASLLIS